MHSTTLCVDEIQGGEPVIEMIDNFVNNRRLTNLFEGSIGKGQLMIASFDLKTDLSNRPEASQILKSILQYMNSKKFKPRLIHNPEALDTLLRYKEEL